MEGQKALRSKKNNISICIVMMNKSQTDLERHEGKYLKTEFAMLDELTF